jgi:hypothetical protein
MGEVLRFWELVHIFAVRHIGWKKIDRGRNPGRKMSGFLEALLWARKPYLEA